MKKYCAKIKNLHPQIQNIFVQFWSKYYLHCGLAFALYSFLPTFFWLDFAIKVEIQNETLVTIVYPEVLAKANNVTAIFTVLYFIIFIALGVMASAYFSKQQQSMFNRIL